MQKIIRERYEAGELVSREVEVVGIRWMKVAKLAIHAVAAFSLLIIAVVAVSDSIMLRFENMGESATSIDSSCHEGSARRTAT
ncbi:MAG: hypothetical protein ACM3SV_04510 [Betaproteobacteria bacterium]